MIGRRTVARTTPEGPRVDVSELLSLSSTPARGIVIAFMLSNVLYTFATLERVNNPIPSVVAMLLVNAASWLLVQESPDPFPRRWALIVLLVVIVSTVLVFSQLPPTDVIGRETWHLGSNTWLLFFLTLRGRGGLAWIAFGSMVILTVMWCLSIDKGLGGALGILDTHIAILVVAVLFRRSLRRASRRINEFHHQALETAEMSATQDTEREIRRQRVAELASTATPLLELVAGPKVLTAPRRTDLAVTEASLRDGVRAKSLSDPSIVAAVAAARRRGVEVTLLDDRGSALDTGLAMARMVSTVTGALADAESGSATIRLVPPGRDEAVTILLADASGTRRIQLDAEGREI